MGMLDALLGWLVKSSRPDKEEKSETRDFAPAVGEADPASILSVLVANMEGTHGAAATERIKSGFLAVPGLHVLRVDQSITLPGGPTDTNSLLAAEEQGRDMLFLHKADVLVWGFSGDDGKTISLRFVAQNPAPEGRPGGLGLRDQLDLPGAYSTALEDVVIATALAAGAPMRAGSRTAAMKLLHDYCAGIRPLVKAGLEDIAPSHRLTVLSCIGNVVATDAVVHSGKSNLSEAEAIYKKAIAVMPPDTDGARQAMLHIHLADVLQARAADDDDSSVELAEQVVTSLQTAVSTLNEARYALDWGQAQMRLGIALYRLAVRASRPKLMKESVLALRESLKVFNKATNPGKWAEVMNHIGVIMTAMGEEIGNDAILQQALKVFNETLAVRRREVAALLWAQTTNNMGAAAFALAKRSNDKSLMQMAAHAFEGAAEVYREVGQAQRVHVIEKNLNRVVRRLEIM